MIGRLFKSVNVVGNVERKMMITKKKKKNSKM